MSANEMNIKKLRFTKRSVLIVAVLILFFAVLYMVYSDIKKRAVKDFNNEQLILARTAAQGITSFFNDYHASLTFLSEIPDVINFQPGSEYYLEHFFFIRREQIEAITRIDENGSIIYTYPYNADVIGKDITSQKHVKQLLANQKPVISDVFMSVQGYLAIAIHVPVFNGNTFKGSIAVLIPINKLGEKYLGDIKIKGTGSVWLLSENGVELYCPYENHTGRKYIENSDNHELSVSLMELIKINESGSATCVHFGSKNGESPDLIEKYVTFYKAAIGNTYWTILISCHEEDIYAAFQSLRNRLILLFLLMLVIISYYFYSISKMRNVLREEEKRRKAEKTLHESEERFRTIFNESPIGIELYNAQGEYINSNKSSLSIFGISDKTDISHFNLFAGISLNDERKNQLKQGKFVSYQSVFDFDLIKTLDLYKTSRTGKAYFDYFITPLLNSENKDINGYLLQVQDITERVKAEEEIMMLAHSLKSVNECVSITDLNDKILFVNESFLKIYGYTREELIGKHLGLLRSENSPSEITNEILPVTIQSGWKGELLNKRKDGSEFPIYLSTTTVKDKNGEIIALIGVASDITERKKFEKELIEAREKALESDRLKSAFLANMSHEIRTPMNGILGFTNLLSEPGLTSTEVREYIKIIQKSGERMLNTVNDLIDISKIETGQMQVVHSETSVKEQILSLYNFFYPEAAEKRLSFILKDDITPDNVMIRTDIAKLDSILTNLIKNAIKYTEKGTIEIGASLIKNKLDVYVKDTGIGIQPDRHEAVFNRFEQADFGDTRAFEGSGLGLAIVKAYIEMMGGKIELKSQPGEGSVFSFFIPVELVAENPAIEEYHEEKKDMDELKKLKILIVEDDPVGLQFLKAVLFPYDAEIFTAENGKVAVETIKNNQEINIVLMDLRMPVMDGYEATRQIREFNKRVFIIAQTAFALSGDREKAINAGCNDYISKPILKNELYEKINFYSGKS
jgi:PAS domain S-box-containing protein